MFTPATERKKKMFFRVYFVSMMLGHSWAYRHLRFLRGSEGDKIEDRVYDLVDHAVCIPHAKKNKKYEELLGFAKVKPQILSVARTNGVLTFSWKTPCAQDIYTIADLESEKQCGKILHKETREASLKRKISISANPKLEGGLYTLNRGINTARYFAHWVGGLAHGAISGWKRDK